MKTAIKFLLCVVSAFALATQTRAAQSERTISFALSGFLQGVDSFGNDKALPFRYTTKDVLLEIGFVEGKDFTNGTLLLIDSLTDTNIPSRIVARKGATESDVSDLFQINQGEGIQSSRFFGNVFKNATIYSIDFLEFQTLNFDTNGLALQMQLFSKESQVASSRLVGANRFEVISASLAFDGNGEISDQFGLLGPLKGTVRIGLPKFVP